MSSSPRAWGLWVLLAVTAATYAPSWTHSFHFDDYHSIRDNPYIREVWSIPFFYGSRRMFSNEQVYAGHYRPVLLTTYALNHAVDGTHPRGYHVVNVAVHLATVASVYALVAAWGAGGIAPLLAAALVAWHPLNSEAVLYASARSSLLVTWLMLVAVLAALKLWGGDAGSRGSRIRWTMGFWAATLGALGSKEVAIVLPALVAAALVLRDRTRVRWSAFLREGATPLMLGAVVYLVIMGVPHFLAAGVRGEGARPFSENLLSQAVVWGQTVGLFVAPMGLSAAHHVVPATSVTDPRVIGAVIAAFAATAGWLVLVRRGAWGRGMAWGLVWFAGTLLPTALVPLGALFLEHRAYTPVAGLCLATALGAARVVPTLSLFQRRVSVACAGLILAAAWVGTIQRVDVWRNDVSLWQDAVTKAPDGPIGHNNLALAYGRLGRWNDALIHYQAALRVAPNDPLILVNIGRAYERVGDDAQAEAAFQQGAESWPRDGRFVFALASLYERRGNTAAAVEAYLEGIRLEPSRAGAYGNLGNLYLKQGRWDEARGAYAQAARLDPSDFRVWYNLGVASERLGQREAAQGAYARALRLAPGETRIAEALGALDGRVGGP